MMVPARIVVPVAEAARRLGVSPRYVRILVHAGKLRAERPGQELLVDLESVDRRLNVIRPSAGRPLSAQIAWAMLWQLSGSRASWLTKVERARVDDYMQRVEPESWPRTLGRRAEVFWGRMLAGPLALLREDPRVALGGVSAAAHYGLDLVGPAGDVEFYVEPERFDELVAAKRICLDSRVPNVVVRVPRVRVRGVQSVLAFDPTHAGFAPPAAVVADLVEAGDERSVRAARQLFDGLCGG